MEDVTAAALSAPKRSSRTARSRHAGASLRTRLIALFVGCFVLLAIVVVVAAVAFLRLSQARDTALGEMAPASIAADQLQLAFVDQETGVRGYILSSSRAFLEPYLTGMRQQRVASRHLNTLLAHSPRLLRLAQLTESATARWRRAYAVPAINSVPAHNLAFDSPQALLKSKSLFDAARNRFASLDATLTTRRRSAVAELTSATHLLIGVLVAALVVVLVAALALSRALRRWVTGPLVSIGSDARHVADGELEHPITETGPPDFRRLASDVESMRDRITTELARAESARAELAVRNVELSRSNVELEQFVYVASHDLQEPLRKVTSFVQLLQQRYEGELDERADQYIAYAVDGARRMQHLINDLLEFSRVGRTTERLVRVDLRQTVDAGLANLDTLIEETQATITVGDLPVVRGDAGLLVSLWQNLVGNSLKFRGEQPPVVVIEAARSGQEWIVTVTDNGIGIEPHFADKVFVIFQRLHSREAYEGTGIGLALAKKIVEFHGGRIWLDTDHHPGTRICFSLPVLMTGQRA